MESIETIVGAAVNAVCPVESISFRRRLDKSTWRIQFRPEATPAQRAAAQAVIDGFDVATENAKLQTASTANIADATSAKGMPTIAALRAMTPAQARDWVAANVNTLADAKQLQGTMAAILCVLARRL